MVLARARTGPQRSASNESIDHQARTPRNRSRNRAPSIIATDSSSLCSLQYPYAGARLQRCYERRGSSQTSLGLLSGKDCHPCPKFLQDDQRQRWISLLELLTSEIGRCPSRASKARPKRSSDSGMSRSIVAVGTAWRN